MFCSFVRRCQWIILAIVVSQTSTFIHADDWPHWMGPTNDGVWHETETIETFPETGPKFVWRKEIGAGYAGPSIVGNQLFVMDRTQDENKGIAVENDIRAAGEIAGGERIRCLDVTTGDEIWSYKYDCPYKIAYPTGPRCTPTVDVDLVFALGAMGRLTCLKRSSGEMVWEKELTKVYETSPPVWGYSSHPVVDGEQLLVPVGGKKSGVVAFHKTTGEEIWRTVTTLDICYAPLVIYEPVGLERQLIFWHADGITSLNPQSGAEYWFVKFPEKRNPSQTAIATPVLIGNQLLISEYYQGSLMLEIGSNPPSVVEKWRQSVLSLRLGRALNPMMATPIVLDKHAYGIGNNGRGQGVMRSIDIETGSLAWSKDDWLSEKPLDFSSAFMTVNGDKVYLFNDLGELMIGRLSPEGFTELDRAKLLEPTSVARGRDVVWSHPAFSNGKMFVRNDSEIICVDLKKPGQP